MNETKDLKINQFSRMFDILTPSFCFDDCVATYALSVDEDYEKMYLSSLQDGFLWDDSMEDSIGNHYKSETRMIENLKKYVGIQIKEYNIKFHEAYPIIYNRLSKGATVCVEILGYWCPWDWRYGVEKKGSHAFFLSEYDEEKKEFVCVDPYYNKEDIRISVEYIEKGFVSFSVYSYLPVKNNKSNIELLKDSLSAVMTGGWNQSICELDEIIRKNFDLHKEVIDYENLEQYSMEEIQSNTKLNAVLMDISHNRVRFATLLRKLAEQENGYKEVLRLYAKKLVDIAEKWEMSRMLLMKKIYLKRQQGISDFFADKIKDVATSEKILLKSIYHSLEQEEMLVIENEKNIMIREDGELLYIDLLPYCNNVGIGSKEKDFEADFNGLKEYFIAEYFPGGIFCAEDGMSFHIPQKENGICDNISCRSQKIDIKVGYYSNMYILGCSEWGTYSDTITFLYEDDSIAKFKIVMADWLPNYLEKENGSVAYQSKKIVHNSDDSGENEEECYIYTQKISMPMRKPIKAIILPECATIHIFAISMRAVSK